MPLVETKNFTSLKRLIHEFNVCTYLFRSSKTQSHAYVVLTLFKDSEFLIFLLLTILQINWSIILAL